MLAAPYSRTVGHTHTHTHTHTQNSKRVVPSLNYMSHNDRKQTQALCHNNSTTPPPPQTPPLSLLPPRLEKLSGATPVWGSYLLQRTPPNLDWQHKIQEAQRRRGAQVHTCPLVKYYCGPTARGVITWEDSNLQQCLNLPSLLSCDSEVIVQVFKCGVILNPHQCTCSR